MIIAHEVHATRGGRAHTTPDLECLLPYHLCEDPDGGIAKLAIVVVTALLHAVPVLHTLSHIPSREVSARHTTHRGNVLTI